MQQQQGGQPNQQADAYLGANLTRNQAGLSFEMTRVFNLMQYLNRAETENNPAAKDTLNNKADSPLLKLKPDTNKLNVKPDSPKAN